MPENRDFRDLFAAFSAHDVRAIVVGAHAVVYYSTPRYTKDLDVWIDRERVNVRRVLAALAEFGAPVEDLTLEDLATPGTIFQIGVEPVRIDILTDVGGLDFGRAWERAVVSSYGDQVIRILGLDDLVRAKSVAGRPQDQLDLENLRKSRY